MKLISQYMIHDTILTLHVFVTVNRKYISVRYNSVFWTDDNTKKG